MCALDSMVYTHLYTHHSHLPIQVLYLSPDLASLPDSYRWATGRPSHDDMFASSAQPLSFAQGGGRLQAACLMQPAVRRARFCLAPSGHGFGVRISYAMVTGCVPVIIQDGVRQPLDDVLPYWRFSIRLPQADIPNIERILRAVEPVELALLQKGLRLYHHYFMWRSPQPGADCGLAYEGVLESLRLKAMLSASMLAL